MLARRAGLRSVTANGITTDTEWQRMTVSA